MSPIPMQEALLAAMEATWAPAERRAGGHWMLRRGDGGGKRVSAATALDPAAIGDIATAEAAMRAMGQRPLFMLTPEEGALDAALAARGYGLVDPVVLYAAPAGALAGLDPRGFHVIRSATPLAIQREIWAAGGVGPARLAVMARSGEARAFLLGRLKDRPAGCAFVACSGPVAMLHALEVAEPFRREGLGRALTGAAAAWAGERGCATLGLAVTEANAPARALYEALGMQAAARYHYRALPEESR